MEFHVQKEADLVVEWESQRYGKRKDKEVKVIDETEDIWVIYVAAWNEAEGVK